jgi:hypothetical protein
MPEEGKPQGFSGAIGQFNFEMSASPSEVHVGDPVTVRMIVTGDNLKSVTLSGLKDLSDFKLYDPQIKEENGSKILEQVVIPSKAGTLEIPAQTFSYFDTSKNSYQTISQGPFSIKINAAQGQDLKMVGFDKTVIKETKDTTKIPEQFGRDIVFIKELPGAWQSAGTAPMASGLIWILSLVYAIVWGILFVFIQQQQRLKSDHGYARRLHAPKKAKQCLMQAEMLLKQGKSKEFYDILFKTFQEYCGDKFHLSSLGVTFGSVKDALKGKNISADKMDIIHKIFEECDRIRYSSVQTDPAAMKDILEKIETTIDYIERV